MEKLYTAKEVADITGYSLRTIQIYATKGEIKGEKMNRSWRFTADQIKAFIELKKRQARGE